MKRIIAALLATGTLLACSRGIDPVTAARSLFLIMEGAAHELFQ